MIGLSLLLSVSKHNMWSYYNWAYCCCCPSVNTICGTTINPVITRPHIVFTDGRQQPIHNTTTYCAYWRTTTTINPIIIRPHIVFTDGRQQQYVVVLWLCLLLLSSVSKHNMWSYYDWVVVAHKLCLLTDDNNDNPMIIRPHIVFTDGRQRQPNHNTTTYYVWFGCRCLPSVNTICGRIMIGLLSSVNKHNMWSYYDWVYCCYCPSVKTKCDRIMNGFIVVVVRQWPHIVFIDGRQQPNHNTTTYCVYWRTTTTTTQSFVLWLGLLLWSVSKNNMWSYYEWIYCCCRPSVYTICGRVMIERNHNTTTYCFYWRTTTTTTQS
jgi:hypothetical protein